MFDSNNCIAVEVRESSVLTPLCWVSFNESRYIATYSESQPVTQLSFVAQHDLILTAQANKSDATAAV